jgi:mannose-6-phosphate isomerase-like protein (cupin superfamily)
LPLHPDQEPALLRRFACRNKHNTAHFGIRGADDHCHLSLLEIKGSPVLRRHTRPVGETQGTSTKAARLETIFYQADQNVPATSVRSMSGDVRGPRWSESEATIDGAFSLVSIFTGGDMVEMKNLVKEAEANPGINHLSLWRTDLAYFWVINCEAKVQDDMHYHENDDHIFMVIEGECTVRTPRKEFVLRQFDTVLLKSGESYQLCNTGAGRMLLLGAGNAGVNGQPRTRVPKIPSHIPLREPIVA